MPNNVVKNKIKEGRYNKSMTRVKTEMNNEEMNRNLTFF